MSRQMGFLIGPTFFLAASWFLWGPEHVVIPQARAKSVDRNRLDTGPHRKILGDPPVIRINEFDRTCMDCHRIFLNKQPKSKPDKHRHIQPRHGINTRCYDCHDREDRDRLVLRDGRTIPYTEIVILCAQCHVSIHRDWKVGLHGRQSGFWDVSKGQRKRLLCTECHDPHRPRHPVMGGVEPLPPPNTLRMGTPESHSADIEHESRNPLRRNK